MEGKKLVNGSIGGLQRALKEEMSTFEKCASGRTIRPIGIRIGTQGLL